jgi:hypothetical protein
MVPDSLGEPATSHNAQTLEQVLMIAGSNGTEPFCTSFGPIGAKALFAALVTAHNASGSLEGAWMSDAMFQTPEAAQDHAEDMCGPELWSILGGCEW